MSTPTPRRVVITGLGLISPLGNTIESFWDALISGRSGITRGARVFPGALLQMPWAAEAREFTGDIEDFGPLDKDQKRSIRKGIKVMCREIQMGVAAAQRALADAGLTAGYFDVERTGVVFGSDYILSGPDEFVDAIASCLDARRPVRFRPVGGPGHSQDHALVAAQVPAQHAGQPHRDLQ